MVVYVAAPQHTARKDMKRAQRHKERECATWCTKAYYLQFLRTVAAIVAAPQYGGKSWLLREGWQHPDDVVQLLWRFANELLNDLRYAKSFRATWQLLSCNSFMQSDHVSQVLCVYED
jgi:hypothetical protein